MKAPLEVLEEFSIPTYSFIAAITHLSNIEEKRGWWRQDEYEKFTAEVIGLTSHPQFENQRTARLYFHYAVQETVRAFVNAAGELPDMEEVWVDVERRVREFIVANPWSVKEFNGEQTDENGNTKPKKGEKKEQALSLYRKMNDGKTTRTQIITSLIEEVGMTKAGATTYFHNLKKEYGFSGPKEERRKRAKKVSISKSVKRAKKDKGPSKASIAEKIYLEMRDAEQFGKADIITRIVEEAGTTPAGANTYFCAARKKHEA